MSIYKKSEIPEELQKYFEPAEIGLEETPEDYVGNMVDVFRSVKRVLRDDGTLWLNIGDTYSTGSGGTSTKSDKQKSSQGTQFAVRGKTKGMKSKDLIGIPWMLAFALRADGWYLRQDIIWAKTNPMPESVKDRCTKSHEYIFLLSKSPKYYFDAASIEEDAKWERWGNQTENKKHIGTAGHLGGKTISELPIRDKKNKRDVWTVSTKPFKGAHFASFPPALIEPCILAGCPKGGIVLDPFGGSGTTGMVAQNHGRDSILIELNIDYCKMIKERLEG